MIEGLRQTKPFKYQREEVVVRPPVNYNPHFYQHTGEGGSQLTAQQADCKYDYVRVNQLLQHTKEIYIQHVRKRLKLCLFVPTRGDTGMTRSNLLLLETLFHLNLTFIDTEFNVLKPRKGISPELKIHKKPLSRD